MPSSQNSRRNLSESSLHLGIKKKEQKTSCILRCYLQMNVTSEKLDRMPRLLPRFVFCFVDFSLGGIKVPGAWQMYIHENFEWFASFVGLVCVELCNDPCIGQSGCRQLWKIQCCHVCFCSTVHWNLRNLTWICKTCFLFALYHGR